MVANSVGPTNAVSSTTPATSATAANPTLRGHKLLILTPTVVDPNTIEKIKQAFPDLQVAAHKVEFFQKSLPEGVPEEEWRNVTILLTTGNLLPSPEQAPLLRYVQLFSAGANNILNNPLFKDTDITFCSANGVHGPQITEWVITTWLAFQHFLPQYLEHQREAKWRRASIAVEDAVGRRVGVLGYGAIGRQVARVAKALGSEVYAYTLHPRDTPESRHDEAYSPPGLGDPEGLIPARWFSGSSKEDLHAFLGSGLDLLVISVPLTPKTTHLIGAAEFEVLSARKTYVSNISRGPIIKTDDLIDALEKETIRGAALDVTDPEPLPDGHPLWHAKNVIITPHVSGISTAYTDRVLAILLENLHRFSEDKKLLNTVSRKEGY
ncbi:hypothetical protein VTK73DRAFT_272 [Phialemonium thermophilum]|uniref:D-isomer specific 2-hydroxyacid dehydrogenase NAD-binding domain-containing protein n=1 Tax=Phialemonium thermophilum TaxID=223376 RepID=A0ABR3XGJ9_9PEZI